MNVRERSQRSLVTSRMFMTDCGRDVAQQCTLITHLKPSPMSVVASTTHTPEKVGLLQIYSSYRANECWRPVGQEQLTSYQVVHNIYYVDGYVCSERATNNEISRPRIQLVATVGGAYYLFLIWVLSPCDP